MKKDVQRSFLDPHVLSRLSRLSLHARTLVEGSFSGKHKSPHRGSSVEFSQYRKYVPGDDISLMDWRIYGRTDRFYIKEFEADTNLRCYLALDCSGSMRFGSGDNGNKFEYARSMAATLAHLLIAQGDAVGLQCFNNELVQDIPPRTSPKHLHAIYEVLDAMAPAGETDLVTMLHKLAERIRKRALVIIFSDFFTDVDPLLNCFRHLVFRKHDVAVFHLLDEAETRFDLSRPVRFVDMEGGSSLLTDPALMRNQYLACIREYLDEMKVGCRRHNVDYRLAVTSTGYEKVLSDFLLDRIRRSGR